MIMHQRMNSIGTDIYSGYLYRDHNWSLHMHKSLEIALCLKGRLSATAGQNKYELTEGQALLVMPYQPHSYFADEDTAYFVSLFSKNHIPLFLSEFSDKEPDCAVFNISEEGSDYLMKIHGLRGKDIEGFPKIHACREPSMYARKAALYAICDEISEKLSWHQKERCDDLALEILTYIEKHFTERITLSDMAEGLSYEYHYLSRLFHNAFGTSFNSLVNQYRCEKAHLLLTETELPISQIAFDCGFQSIRSFNRIFLEYSGQAPSSIRSSKK